MCAQCQRCLSQGFGAMGMEERMMVAGKDEHNIFSSLAFFVSLLEPKSFNEAGLSLSTKEYP